MTNRFVNPIIKYTTSTLKTMPGAELYFYITGTTTPKATFQDFNGTIPHAHPVVALSDGHFPPIFLNGTYRGELKYLGITQPGWPVDDIGATNAPAPLDNWNSGFSYSTGQLVTAPNGLRYQSLQNNNLNNEPSASPLWWSQVFLGGNVDSWAQLDTAARSGAGPKADAESAIRYSLDLPQAASLSYIRANADGTYTNQSYPNVKTDLDIAGVTSAAFSFKVNGPASANDENIALFDGTTGRLIKQGVNINNYSRSIPLFSSLASTPAVTGQVVLLLRHTTGEVGGGGFIGVSSFGLIPDGGTISASGTPGVYWKRIDIENLSIDDFGGNGNGVFDNISVFGLIGANLNKRILIPDNKIYYTTGNFSAFENIDYWGGGRFKTPTDTFPGKTAITSVAPTIVGPGLPNYFNGDSVYNSNQEYFIQKTGRYGLSQPYFAAEGNPHFSIFDNRTGASGTDAHLAVACPAGSTSCTLKFTNVGFPTGTVFVMDDGLGHSQQFTSTGLSGGTVVNFTPAVTGATFPISPGFTTVKKANRTQESFHHVEVYHNAGGDGYGQCWRISAGYNAATTAQYHFFQTSTAGMWNGDVSASASGNYLQFNETAMLDNGFDVAGIGEVRTYTRTNNTENRYAFWADRLVKSDGSKKINFGSIFIGNIDIGIDFGGVTNSDCMIGFAPTQKLYFNNTQTIVAGNPFPIGYNTKGNMFMGSDATGTVWELTNNAFKLRFSSSGALLAPGYISVGTHVGVAVNNKVSLNNANDQTYFTFDGATVRLFKNNVQVATW